ncbi:hypothetical protein C8F04DRAFT_1301826 [Mycena alexandri]|uniref:Uncharacterized protein n=1 Tax=Mycena alexandri TaxID=1745969 RepID=A0AAD6SCF1_9AGAR|nr:hypothetical protein C8F04DRAFT_1301826 [Mycena alexandri]
MTSDPSALTNTPTLLIVPSFTLDPTPPLAPIPNAAATALSAIVGAAAVIPVEEPMTLRPHKAQSFVSFLEDDPFSPDLEDFFAPPSSKGKGKTPPPPPPPPPPPMQDNPSAGSSHIAPPQFLVDIGYTLHEMPKRWAAPEHKTTRMLTDTAAMGLAVLDDKIKDLADGIDARLVAFAAEQAELPRAPGITADPFDTSTATAVISAINKHTANAGAMTGILNGALARLSTVEETTNQISTLTATVESFGSALSSALGRLSALSGSASLLAASDDSALRTVIFDVMNTNGKRSLVDPAVEDPSKRPAALVVNIPAAYTVYPVPPPAPAFAAPGFASAAAPTLAPVTAFAPIPIAYAPAPPTAVAPAYAPAPPPAFPAPPAAFAAAPPTAPGAPAYPLPPPTGPPRPRIDPAREVLFGPMSWSKEPKELQQQPRSLINNVLGFPLMRPVRYNSRKGTDDATVVLSFESDEVAKWFVGTWNNNSRFGYEVCVARLNV